ncbi:FmdB family zinc ribbon protein [Spiribacter pallidus]|uniref:FmdB family zinc ribbon protein n=1 Tax=Spiribacter pallidus TaxID=1987936 RepID=UPI0034A081DC
MPIYEYICDDCGHELEALQGLSDDPLTDCPQCENARLRRKISAVAFRLKGGGWYETDFKKDNKRNLAGEGKAEKGNAGNADSGASGKTDSGGSSGQKGAASGGKTGEAKGASGKSENKAGKAQ